MCLREQCFHLPLPLNCVAFQLKGTVSKGAGVNYIKVENLMMAPDLS